MISANNYRELVRIMQDKSAVDHLVEPTVKEDLLKLLGSKATEKFSIEEEFQDQYRIIKAAVHQLGGQIQSKEDLDILKEAQRYLTFILKQEEKLADIKAVQDFKEAVLEVLDEEDPILKDKVIRKLHEKSIS